MSEINGNPRIFWDSEPDVGFKNLDPASVNYAIGHLKKITEVLSVSNDTYLEIPTKLDDNDRWPGGINKQHIQGGMIVSIERHEMAANAFVRYCVEACFVPSPFVSRLSSEPRFVVQEYTLIVDKAGQLKTANYDFYLSLESPAKMPEDPTEIALSTDEKYLLGMAEYKAAEFGEYQLSELNTILNNVLQTIGS